jgi:hypothetical protein
MEIPRSANGEEMTSFDIVELVEQHESHPRGERGTAVLIGGCDAFVDFAWKDGIGRRTSTHLSMVPYGHLRIVKRRNFPLQDPATKGD